MNFGLSEAIVPIIYVSFILVSLITLFFKIEAGIFYIIFFLPLQNVMDKLLVFPYGKDFLDILIVIMLIKSIPVFIKDHADAFQLKSNRKILLLIAYSLISVTILGTMQQFIIWKNFAIMLFLYFIVFVNIKNTDDIKKIIVITAISMFLMDIYFMKNFYVPTHFSPNRRGTGTFSYLGPNELAIFYAWYTPIIIALFFYEKNKVLKGFFGLVSLFNIYPLLYTFSRSGYIVFLIACFVFAIVKSRLLLVVLIMLVLTWQVILPLPVVERINMSYLEGSGYDQSIKERGGLIRAGVESFLRSPIYGYGFAKTASLGFRDGITDKNRKSLHNGVVQILVDMGIIGLLIFIAIYVSAAKSGWNLYVSSIDEISQGLGLGFFICSLTVLFTLFVGNVWIYLNVNGFFWVYFAVTNKYKILQEKSLNLEISSG